MVQAAGGRYASGIRTQRGLEAEVGTTGKQPPSPLEHVEALGNQGHLVTRVLQMWALGQMSALAVQYNMEGAVMDGVADPSALSLSKIGSQGRWLQNCQRDIARNFFTDVELPPPIHRQSPSQERSEPNRGCHLGSLPHAPAPPAGENRLIPPSASFWGCGQST